MAERYSHDKGVEGAIDAVKLIAAAALWIFAFIGIFLSAPLRRD